MKPDSDNGKNLTDARQSLAIVLHSIDQTT